MPKRGAWLVRHNGPMACWTAILSALVLTFSIPKTLDSAAQCGQPNSQKSPNRKLSRKEAEEARPKRALRMEMVDPYWVWLNVEVPYIITPEERAAFMKLATDEEREAFIRNFWERRNPCPGSLYNAFEKEYFQRSIFASEHFGSSVPGWRTDRGRIYIMLGPPDEISSRPGKSFARPVSEGGESTAPPFERWRYREIEGVGTDIDLDFVDTDRNGEYHLRIDPYLKDALLNPYRAWAGYRFTPLPCQGEPEFTRIDRSTIAVQLTPVEIERLRSLTAGPLSSNPLPVDVQADFIRATDQMVLAPVTLRIEKKDLQFQNNHGVMYASVGIYGEAEDVTGQSVRTIQRHLVCNVPENEFRSYPANESLVYQEVLVLGVNRSKLNVVVKDDLSGRVAREALAFTVPSF